MRPTRLVALTSYRATVARGAADIHATLTIGFGKYKPMTTTSNGAYSWASSSGEITTRIGPGDQTKYIFVGPHVYERTSVRGIPGTIFGGATWSERTWSGDPAATLFGKVFASPDPPNPGALLQLLDSGPSSISAVGTERIGGVETTHFRARIPLSRIGSGKPSPALVQQARQKLGSASVTVDFWIDSTGLLRQLTYGMNIRQQSLGPESGLPTTVSTTLDISHYGVPVKVSPPPAGQVARGGTCHGLDCLASMP